MGMPINVLRAASGYDCTNGGVSSLFERLTVVNVDGPFEPSADAPAMILDQHVDGCLRLVPAGADGKVASGWFMFGGNFGNACDSRFSAACERLLGHQFYGAVAIHDRQEAA